jgi:hypothetical protein
VQVRRWVDSLDVVSDKISRVVLAKPAICHAACGAVGERSTRGEANEVEGFIALQTKGIGVPAGKTYVSDRKQGDLSGKASYRP